MTSRLIANRTSPHLNSESFKYIVNCQDRISENTETKSWLELESAFPHDSPDYKIYSGLLDKNINIVAKIGKRDLLYEFEIAKRLENIKLPTFLSYFCQFSCLDNFSELNDTTRYICRNSGEAINIILMPYVSGKQIQDISWKGETTNKLRSLFKHIVYSMLYASKELGISHGDLHLGNVLIKHSQRKYITYGDLGTIPIEGYMPILLDYDRAKIEKQPQNVYTELKRYFLLASAEIPLNLNKSMIIVKLQDLFTHKISITKGICDELSNEIDLIELQTNIKGQLLPDWLKPMKH